MNDLHENIDKLAIKYADEAIKLSASHFPYAYWTAGLASWRLKKYEKAAEYYTILINSFADSSSVYHQDAKFFLASHKFLNGNQNALEHYISKNPESKYS